MSKGRQNVSAQGAFFHANGAGGEASGSLRLAQSSSLTLYCECCPLQDKSQIRSALHLKWSANYSWTNQLIFICLFHLHKTVPEMLYQLQTKGQEEQRLLDIYTG